MKSRLTLLVVAIMFTGCNAPATLLPIPTPSPHSTVQPAEPTATNIPSSPNSISTLAAADSAKLVFEVLKDNGGCEIPCLLGFQADQDLASLDNFNLQFGETNSENVIMSSHRFKKSGGFILLFREGTLATRIYLSYYPDALDAQVKQITLHADSLQEHGYTADLRNSILSPVSGDPLFNQQLQDYLLPNILSTYGVPSQILVAPFQSDPIAPSGSEPFSLVLMYQEQGFFVEYVSFRETIGSAYVGCPWKSHIAISIWNSKNPPPLKEILHQGGMVVNDTNIEY